MFNNIVRIIFDGNTTLTTSLIVIILSMIPILCVLYLNNYFVSKKQMDIQMDPITSGLKDANASIQSLQTNVAEFSAKVSIVQASTTRIENIIMSVYKLPKIG